MDVGVGSFVLVNSLTAGNSLAASIPGTAGGLKHSPFRHALQASVPLVVLGLGRLFSVKATDYQVRSRDARGPNRAPAGANVP